MSDNIFIEPGARILTLPREPASDPKYIKHVYCEGSHFHVLSYSTQGTHCNEPKCIINKKHEVKQR